MYRVWYSTESFADYIIDNTVLSNMASVEKNIMYESDASKPRNFHTTPDHIRKILYLDACDLIVEKDNEPIFSIEVTTEAGTGHNAFQRFARIAASVENNVPAIYIYPEGAIISRKGVGNRWDKINPLVFKALEDVMSIYEIPALLYYYPSDIEKYSKHPDMSPNLKNKGLIFDKNIVRYSGCPDSSSDSMRSMFSLINEIINLTEKCGIKNAKSSLLKNLEVRKQRTLMQEEFFKKKKEKDIDDMSPLSAVKRVPTEYLLNYLSKYEYEDYQIGELLKSRKETMIYCVNAKFRGDPYPGALAAIDYLKCRQGKTFEDRKYNLVLLFGSLTIDNEEKTLVIRGAEDRTIKDFFKDVRNTSKHNLLVKDYADLKNYEIPRYLMQVRYGSTFSKAKHIRVYSYFSDAILFPDGSLWRDA